MSRLHGLTVACDVYHLDTMTVAQDESDDIVVTLTSPPFEDLTVILSPVDAVRVGRELVRMGGRG